MSFTVRFKDQARSDLKVKMLDGGGAFIGEHYEGYEVHGWDVDGESVCFMQKDVEEVIDDLTGKETFDWGNSFFPGHPAGHHEMSDGALLHGDRIE